MVHLQHTPLRKQESIHLWSWATHWVRKCCIQECSIIIKSFFREYKELLKKKKKLFKHSTRSTYISQVEQWWQRSGLTIWQWSQYRIACWEKMEKKKSGQMQFLYNGLKEDIKKIQGAWLLLTRRGPNCNGGSLQDLDAVSTPTTGQFWQNEMVDKRSHCRLQWESLTPTCLLCGCGGCLTSSCCASVHRQAPRHFLQDFLLRLHTLLPLI